MSITCTVFTVFLKLFLKLTVRQKSTMFFMPKQKFLLPSLSTETEMETRKTNNKNSSVPESLLFSVSHGFV